MPEFVQLGSRRVGLGEPCFVVAELGQNHSGDLDTCLKMIEAAKAAGADAVKLQKRDPSMECIPVIHRESRRQTPWGEMSYADYRRRLEFGEAEYVAVDRTCRELGILWFASAWDEPSVAFLQKFEVPCFKVASASLTDHALLATMRRTGLPVIASTGMSTLHQIREAVVRLGPDRLVLLHCRSTYPADPTELNLRAIPALAERFKVPIGYSDHHVGLWMSLCAVVLGACMIERHFTLSRSSWGTDQAASVEPHGMAKLIQQIRRWEEAKGDGEIRMYESERSVMERLRRVP